MALKNVKTSDGGAASAPHWRGDGIVPYRVSSFGATNERIDVFAYTASPEGVVTVPADAIGGVCFTVRAGDTEVWVFEGTPGTNTGWVQAGTGGGGGATDFTDLGDVPADYAGAASYLVRVNGGATGLEFVDGSAMFDALGAAAAAIAAHEAVTDPHTAYLWESQATIQLHCASTGNDTTGDGSSGSPYRTPDKLESLTPALMREGHTVEWTFLDNDPSGNWDLRSPSYLAGGLSELRISAPASTLTLVSGPHTVATVGGANRYLTVSGTPFAAGALRGRILGWASGAVSGGYVQVEDNGDSWIRFGPTHSGNPIAGDTFSIYDPSIKIRGVGTGNALHIGCSAWLRFVHVNATLSLAGQGRKTITGVLANSCATVAGCGPIYFGGSALTDHRPYFGAGLRTTGAVTCNSVISAGRVEAGTTFQSTHPAPSILLSWLGATSLLDLSMEQALQLGGCRLAGGVRVHSGSSLDIDASVTSWIDIQPTGAPALQSDAGGLCHVALAYTPTTEQRFAISRSSGTSVLAKDGGRIIVDAGVAQYLGRGGGATDIQCGTSGTPVANTAIQGGSLLWSDGSIVTEADAGAVSLLRRLVAKDAETTLAQPSSASGVLSLDLSAANKFHVLLTENITSIVISGGLPALSKGKNISIVFEQAPSGGPYTLPGSWSFVDHWTGGGAAPAMRTGAGAFVVCALQLMQLADTTTRVIGSHDNP